MPSIEKLLVTNTAIKDDNAKRPSPAPFGPFLVFEMTARLSDVAPPRSAVPEAANSDRRPDRVDDRREREPRAPRLR